MKGGPNVIAHLAGVVSRQLDEVEGSVAVATNVADVQVVADVVPVERSLPVHVRVAEVIGSFGGEVDATSAVETEPSIDHLDVVGGVGDHVHLAVAGGKQSKQQDNEKSNFKINHISFVVLLPGNINCAQVLE